MMNMTTMARDDNDSETKLQTESIALPPPAVSMSQDREWCVVDVDGEWKKIRFHDYDEIYAIPGLYEAIFYNVLKCSSPVKIRKMLQRCMVDSGFAPADMRVLDLGAGNGMVGEELAGIGSRHIVGIDIIPEAAEATRRDRPGIYQDYFIVDMTKPPEEDVAKMSAMKLNCLTCVAALGFGDIPPSAFANAFNLIAQNGWVGFNVKSSFLDPDHPGGFGGLVLRMIDEDVISVRAREEYTHRLSTSGEPLSYTAFVAVKNRDVPTDLER